MEIKRRVRRDVGTDKDTPLKGCPMSHPPSNKSIILKKYQGVSK